MTPFKNNTPPPPFEETMTAYYAEELKTARESDKNKIQKVLSTAGDKKTKTKT